MRIANHDEVAGDGGWLKEEMKLGGGLVQLEEDQLAGIEDVHQIMKRAGGHG